jgi:hypothetical protein
MGCFSGDFSSLPFLLSFGFFFLVVNLLEMLKASIISYLCICSDSCLLISNKFTTKKKNPKESKKGNEEKSPEKQPIQPLV